MTDREHPLKHELAVELTKARIELHRMSVENKALKEQVGRLPNNLLFFAFSIGIVTGMVICTMIFT